MTAEVETTLKNQKQHCRKCGRASETHQWNHRGQGDREMTWILQDIISGVIHPEDHLRTVEGNRQRYRNLGVVLTGNLTEEGGWSRTILEEMAAGVSERRRRRRQPLYRLVWPGVEAVELNPHCVCFSFRHSSTFCWGQRDHGSMCLLVHMRWGIPCRMVTS